ALGLLLELRSEELLEPPVRGNRGRDAVGDGQAQLVLRMRQRGKCADGGCRHRGEAFPVWLHDSSSRYRFWVLDFARGLQFGTSACSFGTLPPPTPIETPASGICKP